MEFLLLASGGSLLGGWAIGFSVRTAVSSGCWPAAMVVFLGRLARPSPIHSRHSDAVGVALRRHDQAKDRVAGCLHVSDHLAEPTTHRLAVAVQSLEQDDDVACGHLAIVVDAPAEITVCTARALELPLDPQVRR